MPGNYRWPIIMGIAGVVLCILASLTLMKGFGGWNQTFQGPGSVTIEIPATADFRLWHESKTIIDGRLHVVDDDLPAGSVIEITDARGTTIPLQRIRGNMSQEIGSTRRVALGRVEFPAPGSYTVSVTGFEQSRMFRLSEIRFFEHFMRAMLFALPGVLLLMAGLIWTIVITLRSRNSNGRV